MATILLIVAVIGYIISALASVELFRHMAEDWSLTQICVIGAVIIYQVGAYISLDVMVEIKSIRTITTKKGNLKEKIYYTNPALTRFISLVFYIFCTCFSIYATANLAFGKNSLIENKAIIANTALQNEQSQRKLLESQSNTLNAEIKDIISTKNRLLEQKQNTKELWATSQATKRGQIDAEMQKITEKKESEIATKRKELSDINTKLSSPITTKAEDVTETSVNGLIKDKTFNFWFFLLFGAGVDLIVGYLSFIRKKIVYFDTVDAGGGGATLTPKNLETCKSSNFPDFHHRKYSIKKSPISAGVTAKKNEIGFKSSTLTPKNLETCKSSSFDGINKSDVDRYVKYMLDTKSPDGYSKGYINIGRNTGIGVKTAEKIKGYLEMQGIVKVCGNRTRILKES